MVLDRYLEEPLGGRTQARSAWMDLLPRDSQQQRFPTILALHGPNHAQVVLTGLQNW